MEFSLAFVDIRIVLKFGPTEIVSFPLVVPPCRIPNCGASIMKFIESLRVGQSASVFIPICNSGCINEMLSIVVTSQKIYLTINEVKITLNATDEMISQLVVTLRDYVIYANANKGGKKIVVRPEVDIEHWVNSTDE